MNNTYLESVIANLNESTEDVVKSFERLSEYQLNWKPNPDKWSVGECLDHIITTNRSFFATFESIKRGKYSTPFWGKLPFLKGYFGKYLVDNSTAIVKSKMKSPTVFKPTRSEVPANIVEEFKNHQAEMLNWAKETDGVSHDEIIISSPAASFVVYYLKDAWQIIAGHETRHITQAKNVMSLSAFPEK